MIYNASDSKLWRKGLHVGSTRGIRSQDILKLAPHGRTGFSTPRVGNSWLLPGRKKPPHLKAFYFMTFLNLFLVLASCYHRCVALGDPVHSLIAETSTRTVDGFKGI